MLVCFISNVDDQGAPLESQDNKAPLTPRSAASSGLDGTYWNSPSRRHCQRRSVRVRNQDSSNNSISPVRKQVYIDDVVEEVEEEKVLAGTSGELLLESQAMIMEQDDFVVAEASEELSSGAEDVLMRWRRERREAVQSPRQEVLASDEVIDDDIGWRPAKKVNTTPSTVSRTASGSGKRSFALAHATGAVAVEDDVEELSSASMEDRRKERRVSSWGKARFDLSVVEEEIDPSQGTDENVVVTPVKTSNASQWRRVAALNSMQGGGGGPLVVSRIPAFDLSSTLPLRQRLVERLNFVMSKESACPTHHIWLWEWKQLPSDDTYVGRACLHNSDGSIVESINVFSRHSRHSNLVCNVWLHHRAVLASRPCCSCVLTSSALLLCSSCDVCEDFSFLTSAPDQEQQHRQQRVVACAHEAPPPIHVVAAFAVPASLHSSLALSSSSLSSSATNPNHATVSILRLKRWDAAFSIVSTTRMWAGQDEDGRYVLLRCPIGAPVMRTYAVVRPSVSLLAIRGAFLGQPIVWFGVIPSNVVCYTQDEQEVEHPLAQSASASIV